MELVRDKQLQSKVVNYIVQPTKTNEIDGRAWNEVTSGATAAASSLPPTNSAQDQATTDMLTILMTIKSIKSQFIACNNMMDKVILILTHLGKYV